MDPSLVRFQERILFAIGYLGSSARWGAGSAGDNAGFWQTNLKNGAVKALFVEEPMFSLFAYVMIN